MVQQDPPILLISLFQEVGKRKKALVNEDSMGKGVLGVMISKLIHLFFNYQPGLVSLELTQNICEGSVCRVNILTNKRWKDLSK